VQQAQRAFWIVKHGVKMSAMPAWGKTLDDEAIWDVVAFVRTMPDMTPETYQQLSQEHSREARMVLRPDRPRRIPVINFPCILARLAKLLSNTSTLSSCRSVT
jgi:hypothetical protein